MHEAACLDELQGPQPGLGVIVLDALTRREWVQEDYVPRRPAEGEAPDPKVRVVIVACGSELRLNNAIPCLLRLRTC